ncbi:MAG: 4Fe-4S dicluster domain-containing protein, partial [Planctomycetota bacterium]
MACKQENDVPLGTFRTWVKWVEHGRFPDTRREAAVLRCNHCEDAPCVEICPTVALDRRPDAIVDLDADRCIGCAACMQACPYDAIHLDPRHGTAAKCHFCAHRLEVNLAPACVSVCPEEAIKVVDLDDAAVRAALGDRRATVRRPERATRPQTWYLDAHPATLDPLAVDGTRTLSHAEVPDPLPAPGTAAARAVYDVPKPRPWGGHVTAYLATKAVAAGALLAAAVGPGGPRPVEPPLRRGPARDPPRGAGHRRRAPDGGIHRRPAAPGSRPRAVVPGPAAALDARPAGGGGGVRPGVAVGPGPRARAGARGLSGGRRVGG